MPTNIKRYNLAQFIFGQTEIVAESFSITRKQDTESFKAFNSHTPYAVAIQGEAYDWELSNVDPTQKELFNKAMTTQRKNTSDLPLIATYNYDEAGGLQEDVVLYGCYITELSNEANKPFSVKGEALQLKEN